MTFFDIFFRVGFHFLGFCSDFSWNFWDVLIVYWFFFGFFFRFFGFLRFWILWIFFGFRDFFFASLSKWVLLDVTEVTTKQQKGPKISTNSMKSSFLPKGQKNLGQRLKPSSGACPGPGPGPGPEPSLLLLFPSPQCSDGGSLTWWNVPEGRLGIDRGREGGYNFLGDSKSWRASKLHYWLKNYCNFGGASVLKGLLSMGPTPPSLTLDQYKFSNMGPYFKPFSPIGFLSGIMIVYCSDCNKV